EELPAFEKFGFPITQTPGFCAGFCRGPREIADTDAHARRNAGLSASGGGPVAAVLFGSYAYLPAAQPNRAESGIASSFLTAEYFDVRIRDQSKARIPRCTLSLADT